MSEVNYNFLLSLSIIIIGYLLKSSNIISEKNGKVITKIIFNITLPALIFKTILSLTITLSLTLLTFIAVFYAGFMLLISYFFYRKENDSIKGISLMCLIGFNVVHLAFPLIQGIWGQEGLKYIAMFDIGNSFVIFVISYIIGSIYSIKNHYIDRKRIYYATAKKLLTSVPLLAYIFALPLNLLNIFIPIFVSDILDIFGRANSALTLLILGIFLNFHFEKSQWKNILKVLALRYILGLFIGLLFFFLLPFELLYRGILTISLILPIGLAVIPFAVEFEYDEELTGMMVNLSIIISFTLMWTLILFLGFG